MILPRCLVTWYSIAHLFFLEHFYAVTLCIILQIQWHSPANMSCFLIPARLVAWQHHIPLIILLPPCPWASGLPFEPSHSRMPFLFFRHKELLWRHMHVFPSSVAQHCCPRVTTGSLIFLVYFNWTLSPFFLSLLPFQRCTAWLHFSHGTSIQAVQVPLIPGASSFSQML